jgi:N-alpha-acetyltransferase 35, NatC auxiliary subunit
MDSGALEEGDDLDDDFDFLEPLTPQQAIWIIDQLLCREASWHQGYPLSQTLFTSVHLDKILWPDPKQISDAHFLRPNAARQPSGVEEILRAYCLGLIKCCDLVLAMIASQHYYEVSMRIRPEADLTNEQEEDFATQVYNREMLRSFTTDQIIDEMQTAILLSLEEDALPHRAELIDRLNFRIAFLELLSDCGGSIPPTDMKASTLFAKTDPSTSPSEALPAAFNIKIQRRLASSVPPRPEVTCSPSEAFAYFTRMLSDIQTAFEIFSVTTAQDLYTALWTFMSQPVQPSVYVRALVQNTFAPDDNSPGGVPRRDMIVQDLRALVLPVSPLLDNFGNGSTTSPPPTAPHFQAHSQTMQFIDRVCIPATQQYRSFCLNRSRVRRNLCHAAIEWDAIQADAEELDSDIQTLENEKPLPYGDNPQQLAYAYPLSSWVYHYKLLQLRLLIQMGFELEVYAPFEFVDMYWYLSHVTGLHLAHLERMSFFVSAAAPAQKKQIRKAAAAQDTLGNLYKHFTQAKAADTLAAALQRVFTVISRHDPKYRCNEEGMYGSDALRYELRTKPFASLSVPEPLGYEEMKAVSSLEELNDEEVLRQAAALTVSSRRGWEEVLRGGWSISPPPDKGTEEGKKSKPSVLEAEWVRNTKGCIKACIATGIAVSSLLKAIEHGGKDWRVEVPGPGDQARFHAWWAVPKIVGK